MCDFGCVNSEYIQPTAIVPPRPPFKIDGLPEEVLGKIFSYLRANDIQAVVWVNRSVSKCGTAAANFSELASIKNFIQVIMQRLNVERVSGQRALLVGIAQKIASRNFVNLQLLKGHILGVKVKLINVIRTLDDETAIDLRNHGNHVKRPNFLEDIVELATFERQIDAAKLIPDEIMKVVALEKICKALIGAGYINRAIAATKLIPAKIIRDNTLLYIARILMGAGNVDRAIAVAKSIPDEEKSRYALRRISEGLTLLGNIDKAIEVATSIPTEITRDAVLRYICRALIEAGEIDRAIVVAGLISVEATRDYMLGCIQASTQAGN